MKKIILLLILVLTNAVYAQENTQPVKDLLDRVGGNGCSQRFELRLNTSLAGERFIISTNHSKPSIEGSTLLALTSGINWYLNHFAHINISWSQLQFDHHNVTFPLPTRSEIHDCTAEYRYYLNYCTFSYSTSVWDWDRWEKEIDWMALHGINMPLQIVGLEAVWQRLLLNEFGYNQHQVNEFVAGPCFMAWFGMNNLEGWGGPNPDWWYERQAELGKRICDRERELGMSPVLPGYCGMVPSSFTNNTGIPSQDQGLWCNFQRPNILNPNSDEFQKVASLYYKYLHDVMGESTYYSMDPFHEGGNTRNIDVAKAYASIFEAMDKASSNSKWVIQQWQFSNDQYKVMDAVPHGRLVVLDLKSDAESYFNRYKGHDAVYCIIPNFGGRTGISGRLNKVMRDFYTQQTKYNNVKGVGAAPEAIESVSVMYDMLFELPWMNQQPDSSEWINGYVESRYGVKNQDAIEAWKLLQSSVYNFQDNHLQGPHEAVVCARPDTIIDRVSSWGGTELFYDPKLVQEAVILLQKANLEGSNYVYDCVDVERQALTDKAKCMLEEKEYDAFLETILVLDNKLKSVQSFNLDTWITAAKKMGTTPTDKKWLERNARLLISTWGDRKNAENSGLRDYSYREWSGMLRSFYYPRWKRFFDNNCQQQDWFEMDWNWANQSAGTIIMDE